MIRSLTLAAALCTTALTANAASLLVNGDFEAGNTGFATDLTYNPTNGIGAASYDIDTNPNVWFNAFASYGDHTSGTGNMMMVNGSTTQADVVWSQTVTVATGTAYDFGGWISAMFPGPSSLSLVINSVAVGTITGPSTTGTWQQFAFAWNSGASTSAAISLLQASTQFGGNDYALDDLSFTGQDVIPDPSPVPLPASLPLMLAGLGGLAALRRRRNRR